MSILIKGMEMPQNCDKCRFQSAFKLYCDAMPYNFCGNTDDIERPDWCPLIEVHTPHGRLGDLDELEKQFKRAIRTYLPKDPTRHMNIVNGSECRGWTQALTAVQEAKTVIEAEGTE